MKTKYLKFILIVFIFATIILSASPLKKCFAEAEGEEADKPLPGTTVESEQDFEEPVYTAVPSSSIEFKEEEKGFTDYVNNLLKYSIVFASILTVIIITLGGFEYIMAGGSESKVQAAKDKIWSAIMGILLILGSYLILYSINPDLVNLELGLEQLHIKPKHQTQCCDSNGNPVTPNVVCSFKEGPCEVVDYTCPQGSTTCDNYCLQKEAGTECGNGYCYFNQCYPEITDPGEPCGNSGYSYCKSARSCHAVDGDYIGGSDCPNGYQCCKDKE